MSSPFQNSKLSNLPTSLSIIAAGVGIVGIGISLITHYFSVSHGSTAQLEVDKRMLSYISSIAVLMTLAIGGLMFYVWSETQTKQYVLVFGMAWLSVVVAYIAFLTSLYQVKA